MEKNKVARLKFSELGSRFEETATATDGIFRVIEDMDEIIKQTDDPEMKKRLSALADRLAHASRTIVSSASSTAADIAAVAGAQGGDKR